MLNVLILATVIVTLPFGAIALVAPIALFAQLGVRIDAAGAFVARGYGATLVAYGLVLYLGRRSADARTIWVLVMSMVLFNAIDAVIQGAGASQGIAGSPVFVTATAHAVLAVLSVVALVRLRR